MSDNEMQKLWSSSNDLAIDHFENISPNLKKVYNQKGIKELRNVQIYHWIFFAISVLGLIGYSCICIFKPGFFGIGKFTIYPIVNIGIGAIYFLIYWTLSFRYYLRLNSDITKASSLDIKSSLEAYLEALTSHRKNQIFLGKIFIILCYSVWFVLNIISGSNILYEIIYFVIFASFSFSVDSGTFNYFFEDSETELKILLQQLSNEK